MSIKQRLNIHNFLGWKTETIYQQRVYHQILYRMFSVKVILVIQDLILHIKMDKFPFHFPPVHHFTFYLIKTFISTTVKHNFINFDTHVLINNFLFWLKLFKILPSKLWSFKYFNHLLKDTSFIKMGWKIADYSRNYLSKPTDSKENI